MKLSYIQYKADGPIYLHFGEAGTIIAVENHAELNEIIYNLETFANEIALVEKEAQNKDGWKSIRISG
jgi:hypothetical protein